MSKKIEYLLSKKKDDFCSTTDQFKNLLLTNSRVSINKDSLSIGKSNSKFKLVKEETKNPKEVLFTLCFENNLDEEKAIKCLEDIDKLIRRVIDKYSDAFYLNTIWDDVSTYYGIKAYPKINMIENKMRKIIYIFMNKNIGSTWVEKSIPKDVKDSITKTLEKNNIHNVLEDCLYSADFIQLGLFFFEKYSFNNDLQKLVEELKTTENLISTFISDAIEKYEKKSNWERYFSREIEVENLLDKWKVLYDFRNKVAHNKKIDKEDYINTMKIIDELELAFNKCLENVNSIELVEIEQEAIQAVAEESIEKNLVNNVTYSIRGNCRTTLSDYNKVLQNLSLTTNKELLGLNNAGLSKALQNLSLTTNKELLGLNNAGLSKALQNLSLTTNKELLGLNNAGLSKALQNLSLTTNKELLGLNNAGLSKALQNLSLTTNKELLGLNNAGLSKALQNLSLTTNKKFWD